MHVEVASVIRLVSWSVNSRYLLIGNRMYGLSRMFYRGKSQSQETVDIAFNNVRPVLADTSQLTYYSADPSAKNLFSSRMLLKRHRSTVELTDFLPAS